MAKPRVPNWVRRAWEAWHHADALRGLIEVIRFVWGIVPTGGLVFVIFGGLSTAWLILFIPMLMAVMAWYVLETTNARRQRPIVTEPKIQAVPPSEPEQAEEAPLTVATMTPEQLAYLKKLQEPKDAAKIEQLRVVFRAAGNPAWQDGAAILRKLSGRLREVDLVHAYAADMLDMYVLNDRNRERLDAGIEWYEPSNTFVSEVERLFGDFYEAYVEIGNWIHRVADLLNWSLSEDSEYSRWRERDQSFRSRLRDTCAKSDFSSLERLIEPADSLVQWAS